MNLKFHTVSKSLPRHEAASKASGKAIYTDDIHLPGMVYGMILRSPYAHARVLSVDLSAAEEMEDFLGALLPEEVPDKFYNSSGNPPSPLLLKDEKILTDHPLCPGDRVIAIAAKTPFALKKAAALIKIQYEILPAVHTMKEALASGLAPIQPHLSKTNILAEKIAEQGDVDQGFQEASFIFEDDFHTSPMQHVALEPTSCICDFSDGIHLNIWSNSQTPYQERRILAELFSMPENNVRIVKPAMGGGFGARQQLHNQPACALLSKKIRRPVKMINTREEEMYASVIRHEMDTHLKFGVTSDGILTAFETDYYLNCGPYTTHTPTIVAAASRKFQYRVPNYLFHGYTVATNDPVAGAFRGYGNAQLTFGRELMMSRIARQLNLDPIEFRLKNHIKAGEKFPAATAAVTSCAIEKCARRCLEIQKEIDEREGLIENDEICQAWGVAFSCHGSGPSSKEGMSAAVILVNDDGTVHLMTGSADIGQGSETMLMQIAAKSLGIPLSQIKISAADTDRTPYDTGTFGSSQTYVSGNAVVSACEDLIQRLIQALRISFEDTEVTFTEAKTFLIPSQEKELTFQEAVRHCIFGMKGMVLIGSASYKAQESPNPFAVCMVKAEYEKKTNRISLKHVIETVDVGTAINPLTVKGQIEGGVCQGIGYALTESLEFNKRAGKTNSSDLLSYRIPLLGDMPDIHGEIVESYEPTGPHGAKSVGELCTVPVAPAIVDAVCQASGKKINRIPLSEFFLIKPNQPDSAEEFIRR